MREKPEKQNFVAKIVRKVVRFLGREPELPEDPYAYVRVPKKPRLPGRSAQAVLDLPED
jgi:hypothetical protein